MKTEDLKAKGLSDEQIAEILVLDVKEHEYFSSQGVYRHLPENGFVQNLHRPPYIHHLQIFQLFRHPLFIQPGTV